MLKGWQEIKGTWYYFSEDSGIYDEHMGHEGPTPPTMPAPPGGLSGGLNGESFATDEPDGVSLPEEALDATEPAVTEEENEAETEKKAMEAEAEKEEIQNFETAETQKEETSSAEDSVQKYTVTLQIDSDKKQEIKVQAGNKLRKPADPEKEGYSFLYWYILVQEGTETKEEVFDFSQEITKDITIYAKWKEDEPEAESLVAPGETTGSTEANTTEPTQEPAAEPVPAATPEPAPTSAPTAPAEPAPVEAQPEPAPTEDGSEG